MDQQTSKPEQIVTLADLVVGTGVVVIVVVTGIVVVVAVRGAVVCVLVEGAVVTAMQTLPDLGFQMEQSIKSGVWKEVNWRLRPPPGH